MFGSGTSAEGAEDCRDPSVDSDVCSTAWADMESFRGSRADLKGATYPWLDEKILQLLG